MARSPTRQPFTSAPTSATRARALEPEEGRGSGRRRVEALALHQVGAVHARAVHRRGAGRGARRPAPAPRRRGAPSRRRVDRRSPRARAHGSNGAAPRRPSMLSPDGPALDPRSDGPRRGARLLLPAAHRRGARRHPLGLGLGLPLVLGHPERRRLRCPATPWATPAARSSCPTSWRAPSSSGAAARPAGCCPPPAASACSARASCSSAGRTSPTSAPRPTSSRSASLGLPRGAARAGGVRAGAVPPPARPGALRPRRPRRGGRDLCAPSDARSSRCSRSGSPAASPRC